MPGSGAVPPLPPLPRLPRLPRLLARGVESAAGVAALLALALAGWMLCDATSASGPPQPVGAGHGIGPVTAAHGSAVVSPLPAARPVRIRIGSLGLDAPLVPVGLDAQGRLEPPPPDRPQAAGWYADGVTPGARGTAVVVGHVDSRTGPAVFFLLGRIHSGETILINRQDGRVAVFTVDAVRLLPKAHFPTSLVYRPSEQAELRVITCGGRYDPRTGYRSDVVVFAHLGAVR